MQLRDNDMKVNDLPKSMQCNPTVSNHAIIGDNLTITLYIKGIISNFGMTKPSKEEWENSLIDNHIVLSYETPTWDPHSESFQAVMMDQAGNIITPNNTRKPTLSNHSLGYHYCMQMSIPSIGTMVLASPLPYKY